MRPLLRKFLRFRWKLLFAATLASVAAGLSVSAVRWLVLDTVHHRTGVRQPSWDFSSFQRNRAGFVALAFMLKD